MSMEGQYGAGWIAGDAPLDRRLEFVRRTYIHLAGSMVAFIVLSTLLYQLGVGALILSLIGGSRFGWLLILGAFAIAGWLATSMAQSDRGAGAQYAGLALYVIAEALIFSPLIAIASIFPGTLPSAAAVTIVTFTGLTVYVVTTKKDFSFLGAALVAGSLVALGLIVLGAIFGFGLGTWFSGAMILFACGAILYSTSKVLREYRTDQYVAAALELFAAVALLFWYVLRLLLQLQRR
jgi:FtsH-binding integral membrane protein